MSKNLNIWIEGTIIAALATVLSLIPFNIGPSFSVTVGAPVMMLYCLRRGLVPGFFASFLWGVLHILIGTAYILTPLQGFIEYFIAFGFTGLAGLFTPKVQQAISNQNQKMLLWNVFIALSSGLSAAISGTRSPATISGDPTRLKAGAHGSTPSR